jgi:DNA-binding response OmpR family regulator
VHVLVVEDDPTLAELLSRGLRQDGLLVDVARDGEGALSMTAAAGYDAILLDMVLPGIGGLETCRLLREHAVTTPVLILSARAGHAYRMAAHEAGADDYVTKPFDFDDLAARLSELARLGGRR